MNDQGYIQDKEYFYAASLDWEDPLEILKGDLEDLRADRDELANTLSTLKKEIQTLIIYVDQLFWEYEAHKTRIRDQVRVIQRYI
jgi:hypothetical protein